MKNERTKTRAMNHRFHKEEGTWFIDLPSYLEAGLSTKANLMIDVGAEEKRIGFEKGKVL